MTPSPFSAAFRFSPFRYARLLFRKRQQKRRAAVRWAYIQTVLTTIGNMTVSWAGMELMLLHLILWYHPRGGQQMVKAIPTGLSKQLDYIDEMAKDVRFSVSDAGALTNISAEMRRLNEVRNDIIHGVMHQTNSFTLRWYSHRIRIVKGVPEMRHVEYTSDELSKTSADMGALGSRISPFFARLTGMPHPDND